MKDIQFTPRLKTVSKTILLLIVLFFSLGIGNLNTVSASKSSANEDVCGTLLAEAEARFISTLAPDGSVPVTPENKAAAQEYIRVSKLCYEQVEAQSSTVTAQEVIPTFIDEGGVILDGEHSAEYVLTSGKWGQTTRGTPGGVVTYSFMGNGVNLSAEGSGTSVALSSLPAFQPCFITQIQNAFAAWQVVADIKFVQVADNGLAFNAEGAAGDIRIGAHTFDGPSGVLAHAYYAPPNGTSAAGDMHFDSAEKWTCNTSGINMGVVALHELGHSLGLGHENTTTVAVMDPYYNTTLTSLQTDDINGITSVYGPALLVDPPSNDDFDSATAINSIPREFSIDATGATQAGDDKNNIGPCSTATTNKFLNKGQQTVWYRYTPSVTTKIALDTHDSSYDTYIAVWTGARGALNLVECNDDTFISTKGKLAFVATAGTSYHIEIGLFNGYFNEPPMAPETNASLKLHATSFEDVPGNYWAWRWIEGFYNQKITTGCSITQDSLLYCPDREVTRAEMAVFLLRAKYGANYQPSPTQTGIFADVPVTGKEWMKPWIEKFYEDGTTTGCANPPLSYCPERPVTRAEMAVFILRAKYGANYQPNPSQTGIFADVPVAGKEWMKPWIEKFYEEGITTGCASGPLRYCPERPVTRAEMAVFIDRAFGILPIP